MCDVGVVGMSRNAIAVKDFDCRVRGQLCMPFETEQLNPESSEQRVENTTKGANLKSPLLAADDNEVLYKSQLSSSLQQIVRSN